MLIFTLFFGHEPIKLTVNENINRLLHFNG